MARKPKSVNSGDTLGLDVPEGESALEKAHRVMAERRAAGETIPQDAPRAPIGEANLEGPGHRREMLRLRRRARR